MIRQGRERPRAARDGRESADRLASGFALSATAETVRLLSAPAELSREPSANADCAAAWSALELPDSALNADAWFAINPAATCRLWNEEALLMSAANWPPLAER